MGLFPRIAKRSSDDPMTNPNHSLWNWVSPMTKAGTRVSEDSALKYLTIYACVSLIAGDVARLPLILYRKTRAGRERLTDHPLYDLLHTQPNPETSSYHFREAGQGQGLLWGNNYSLIERTALTGEIKALWQIEKPGQMKIERDEKGRIFYSWRDRTGQIQKRPKSDILHIPGFSLNGLKGISNIAVAREAIGLGLALEEFGARFFGEGMNMAGIISMDKDLGDNEADYIKALRAQYAGLGKSHGVMLLQNGETYQKMSIPMEDAQFIESRKFQKTEICGFYHVPPHKIAVHGENSNYNNLEQENQSYVDSCLMHWFGRWESCLNMQLLTPKERRDGLFFEFLVDGMLRGDSKSRSEFYRNLWQVGGLTADEIRIKENMNPLNCEGSDKPFVPLNFIPMDQAAAAEPVDSQEGRTAGKIERRAASQKKLNTIIKSRDRVRKRYMTIITDAIERIVSHENDALTAELDQQIEGRDKAGFVDWLDGFYKDFPEFIDKSVRSGFVSYMETMFDTVSAEIGVDDPDFDEIMRDVNAYIAGYARQYVSSSRGQIIGLLDDLDFDAVLDRVGEWQEKRLDKEVAETSVGIGSMIARTVILGAGLRAVWRTRGDSCPLCNQLDGRVVGRMTEAFTDGAEDFTDGDGNTVNFRQTLYSPLHKGCDCVIVAE